MADSLAALTELFLFHSLASPAWRARTYRPNSNRRRNATPRHATPRHTTPRHATPHYAEPRRAGHTEMNESRFGWKSSMHEYKLTKSLLRFACSARRQSRIEAGAAMRLERGVRTFAVRRHDGREKLECVHVHF